MSREITDISSTLTSRDSRVLFEYIMGEKVKDIADRHRISTKTLYELLYSYGIPKKGQKETLELYSKEIFRKVTRERKSLTEVAREVKLPVDVVKAFIQREYKQIDKKAQSSVKEVPSKPKPNKGLGKDGLIGHLPSSNKPGLSISQTYEDAQKRESVEDDKVNKFADMLGEGFDDEEKVKLSLLRALLKHASEHTDMTDYSEDLLLLPDYLLPIDLVIMKDMTRRSVEGEKVRKIASAHRTDEKLVSDLLTKGVDRNEFRERFIKSLVDRGLIQF